jgi:lipid-binding SYLF domain-containing protein
VLCHVLKHPHRDMTKQLFEKCIGIVIMSVVQGGFVFAGSIGTGILLKKKQKQPQQSNESSNGCQYSWSLPTAVGMSGIGYGILAGVSYKDLVIFLMDEMVFQAIASSTKGFKLGGQGELTLGNIGRALKLDFNYSSNTKQDGGFGSTVSFAYSKGLFGGISLEGAMIGRRDICNLRFYHGDYTPTQIVTNEDNSIQIPEHRTTLLKEVYDKLNVLSSSSAPSTTSEDSVNRELEKLKIREAKEYADTIHQSLLIEKPITTSTMEAAHPEEDDIVYVEAETIQP